MYNNNNNMPGGLIQIASYGCQDLFLTGVPEITFFKVVYRRYTNFSMESVQVFFDDPVEFGGYSIVKIPKIGDLMHKTYIEIRLPRIELFRRMLFDTTELKILHKQTKKNYYLLEQFMDINRNAFVNAYDKYIAENNLENTTEDIITDINYIFEKQNNIVIEEQFKKLIAKTINTPFTYDEISMQTIANTFDYNSDKNILFNALMVGINKSIKLQKFFFDIKKNTFENLKEINDKHLKFAWVKRIGHAIIKSVEVKIGGHKIDKDYGDWLNIWYELTANRNMENIYYKMIGNVPELITFDRNSKPSYLLRVPLQFWFCKFSGIAIPLIALEYHDVSLYFKFRKFEELCYIEPNIQIKIPSLSNEEDGISLEEVPDELCIDINAWLLIDYIYLDSSERRRFAQSSHEYLIEQLQRVEICNGAQQEIQVSINNFVNPSKELIWVSQKEKYTVNLDGTNECRWDNYSLTDLNKGNPINYTTLYFNSYTRVIKLDGNYFNYVQPYEVHNTTPSDGINIYSFSLFPEELQPSGTANLSRMSRIVLQLQFDSFLFNDSCFNPLIIRVYTRNLNILRIINGFAGISFTY